MEDLVGSKDRLWRGRIAQGFERNNGKFVLYAGGFG